MRYRVAEMYDARNLKPRISVSETHVECPVRGCLHQVVRQRSVFRRKNEFQCPQHKIFISSSTFEYPSYLDNLLWKDGEDIDLLNEIKNVKRESRMARDNSEDALSWNVFRYLEKTGNLSSYLSLITETNIRDAEVIYWSYSQSSKGSWPKLNAARQEFGETMQRGSEPDLIVVSSGAIFFIEAKFTATNKTMPSDPENSKGYVSGADQWYQEVFISDYDSLANKAKKYELLRFWLLGSWIATQNKSNFYLVNLVRAEYEHDIESRFIRHIKSYPNRRFMRITWEDIYNYVMLNSTETNAKNTIISYFENKAVGFNRFGELQPAFATSIRI